MPSLIAIQYSVQALLDSPTEWIRGLLCVPKAPLPFPIVSLGTPSSKTVSGFSHWSANCEGCLLLDDLAPSGQMWCQLFKTNIISENKNFSRRGEKLEETIRKRQSQGNTGPGATSPFSALILYPSRCLEAQPSRTLETWRSKEPRRQQPTGS